MIWSLELVSDVSTLRKREEHWISFFKPLGLMNLNDGAGMSGRKVVISELNRQKTIARNKLGLSEETRLKISLSKRGKKQSPEQIAAWMATPGFIVAKEKLYNHNLNQSIEVVCCETGERFTSLNAFKKMTGVSRRTLERCAKRGWKIGGLTWQMIRKENNVSAA